MVTLRHPAPDDAYAIASLQALSWQTAYRGIVSDSYLDSIDVDAWAERYRTSMVEDTEGFVSYVAEIEDEIVGWAVGGPSRDSRLIYSGELFTIYLLPGYERRGIGRKLIRAVARSLVDLGFESMIVWALSENWPARRFYEALGGSYVVRGEMDIEDVALPVVSYGWRHIRVLVDSGE